MQTEQVEATLKANIDVAVATVVSDLADAAIFDTSSNAYEHAGRKLASIGTDTINQTLKFSFAKYATSVQNMHGLVGGAGKNHNVLMETLDARVSATTKTSLVHIIDTIFPSLKTAAGALLKFIVVNQSKITDSHRAASDVSRIIQGVCEEAFEAITALLNSFSRGLKQLANKFLTSGEAAIGVMVDDAANSVLQFALATLSKFSEGAPTPPPTTESSTSSPPTSPTVTPSSGRAWILAHNVLVAALLSKKFVTYQVEGFGASGSSSSSALQGAFASATKKLIAHFVVLAGQHFSLLFQKEYLSLPDPTDIAGPHRAFQQVFGQWMSLHSECLMWFPDGQGKLTERIGHRHERSYSQGSASSSQQSFRPSQHAMSSAAGSGAGGRGQQQGIPPVATFNRQGNEVVGRLGGTSKRLAIIPTTIDARHIQEAVILYALLSLKDLVCIIHFTRPAFQQLQVDLSFILQQTSPNASYWLRDDDLFVSIVNDIATVAYSRTLGEKVPLTQGMVEKLARKDD